MSSKLQLDVCDHNKWWRYLVNVYEVEAGMVLFAVKLWYMPERRLGECIYMYDKGAVQIYVTVTYLAWLWRK